MLVELLPGDIPVDAPFRLYLRYCWVLHIFKLQISLELGSIYTHRHRNIPVAMQGGMCSAG